MAFSSRRRSGFTLVELLISVSILAVVVSLALTGFLQFTQKRAQLQMEQQLYENARFLMERLTKEIRENTIDYEEYWNRAMTGGSGFTYYGNRTEDGDTSHVENNYYFCSSSTQIDTENYFPKNSDYTQKQIYRSLERKGVFSFLENCLQNKDGTKQLYGQLQLLHTDFRQPYNLEATKKFNHLDDEELGMAYFKDTGSDKIPLVTLPKWIDNERVANNHLDTSSNALYGGMSYFYDNLPDHLRQNELYLINSDRTERTILRLRSNEHCAEFNTAGDDICPDATVQSPTVDILHADKTSLLPADDIAAWIPQQDSAIQQLKLIGLDYGLDHRADISDGDGTQYDGTVDTWACHPEYDCTSGLSTRDGLHPLSGGDHFLPTKRDMGFTDITSKDISIKELSFYITPVNDPKYAWGVEHPVVQNHPQVRIVLTVIPGYDLRRRLKLHGPLPEVTLITTVSSRVY